jgi:hypothetical protein
MLFKAELNKKVDVMRWYDARDNSCYIICTGTKIDPKQIFSKWLSDDDVSGREKLEIALNFIEENQSNYNAYTLVSFPYEDGIEKMKVKDLEGEIIRFQFNTSSYSSTVGSVAVQSISEGNSSDYGKVVLDMMQKQHDGIMMRMELMEQRLEQQEEEEEEEEEEAPVVTGKDRLMGAVAGIIEKPEFTETMFAMAGMAIGKLFKIEPTESKETQNEQ